LFVAELTKLVPLDRGASVLMVSEMPTPPWIKPLLLSLGASVATSAVWITTAKNRHRKAKRRRKLSTKPVIIGTVAKRDAALEVEDPLTLADMKASAMAMVARLKALAGGAPVEPAAELLDKNGKVIRTRKGRRRKQASWMDSARESMRQVVKEEVQQKVDQTGLGKAQEVLQQAAGVAKDTLKKVQDAVPDELEGKLSAAGKSIVAGAKRVGEAVRDGISQAAGQVDQVDQVDQLPPSTSTPSQPSTSLTNTTTNTEAPVEAPPVAERVADGLKKASTWIQGPGTPGYTSNRRASSGGDVVEAKDAPTKPLN
jgi:hypothetical protein